MKHIAIFGASGALGRAFCQQYASQFPQATIRAITRQPFAFEYANIINHVVDYDDETDLHQLVDVITQHAPLDCVIVTLGILHDLARAMHPEKSLRQLNVDHLHHVFHVNTVLPLLIAKHVLPTFSRHHRAVFAVLSARVGSISDNRLGGWYSYRSAKAALNMAIKTLSIEMNRTHPHAIVVGLHPGTVDSNLSEPFQKNVPHGQLFPPDYATACLINVLAQRQPIDSGKIWAWDGQEILP